MIKIDFTPPNTTEWSAWIADGNTKATEHISDFTQGNDFTVSGPLYKRLKSSHYFNGEEPFFGKCVYCEQKIMASQHGDIEHFRPKGKVTDENDIEITKQQGGVTTRHPGYYWLAYDWTNLLPSCGLCNQPSNTNNVRLGKRNRFPVLGNHSFTPLDPLDTPLLLNPLTDEPADHIELVIETGVLRGRTEKGIMTIKVLGLNERGLPGERLEHYRDTYDKLLSEYVKLLQDAPNSYTQTLEEINMGRKRYTLVSRYAFHAFKSKVDENAPQA